MIYCAGYLGFMYISFIFYMFFYDDKYPSTRKDIHLTILGILFWPVSFFYLVYMIIRECYNYYKSLPYK